MLVSNTSTLVLLAKTTLLEVWITHAGPIVIPLDVQEEATKNKEYYDALIIKKFIDDKKILVQKAPLPKIQAVMKEFRLDIGEAAAYALFNPKKHEALMTDDGELIKVCKIEGIPFVGALGIAAALYKKGILSQEIALKKIENLWRIGRYRIEVYTYFHKLIQGEHHGNCCCTTGH